MYYILVGLVTALLLTLREALAPRKRRVGFTVVRKKDKPVPPRRECRGTLVQNLNGTWTCICPYPDILNGPSCETLVACDGKGKLIDSEGKEWDGDGNPYVANLHCSCDGGTVALDGDPLRCHPDPCLEGREGGVNLFNGKSCACDKLGFVESNVDGKCRPPPELCNWDNKAKTCRCPPGLSAVFCQSSLYTRDSEISQQCDGNSAGCKCTRPCPTCQNGGTIEAKEVEPGKFACSCQCPTQGSMKYYGQFCENSCFIRGTEVPDGQIHKCCSGRASHWCQNPPLCSMYTNTCR